MSYHPDDTICAIGTAAGGAARGMVRVSGPDATAIAARLFVAADGRSLDEIRQPTAVGGQVRIVLVPCREPMGVPCDLFLWPGNRSYTREPVAELHTVGSPPVLQAVLAGACRAGARLAEPGEFTLRAFLAGRLDLTQAEAVLGVIDAGGADELQAALAQLAGGLARPLHQLREDLVQLLAELEAGLDFVEEDIRFISQQAVLARLESAGSLLATVTQQLASRYAARELPQVALVGPPNVGKSSLFNALVERFGDNDGSKARRTMPALVSARRGTTRDYLTAMISLDGVRCELVDTAGVDGSDANLVESIAAAAQAFATERRRRAAVRACCVEASTGSDAAADVRGDSSPANCDVVVLTKADLVESSGNVWEVATPLRRTASKSAGPHDLPVVITSSRTGAGLDEFRSAVQTMLSRDTSPRQGRVIAATAERCGESIRLAANAVEAAAELTAQNAGDELIAAELRVALAELGKVVGAVYTDDLLDRIFRTFCIGK